MWPSKSHLSSLSPFSLFVTFSLALVPISLAYLQSREYHWTFAHAVALSAWSRSPVTYKTIALMSLSLTILQPRDCVPLLNIINPASRVSSK